MIYIGIDPSLVSTSICIEVNGEDKFYNFTTNPKRSKWHNLVSNICTYHTNYYSQHKDYTKSEISKNLEYDAVAIKIINIIMEYVKLDDCIIGIEGYSYSSSSGPLIDLVTFSTLLRNKILKMSLVDSNEFNIKKLLIIQPSLLKSETCKRIYNRQIKKNSKMVFVNLQDITGGSFKKTQMVQTIFDNAEQYNNSCSLYNAIKSEKEQLLSAKAIPKPIDDMSDSYWIKEYIKDKNI
jgi:hypothetical protein